MPTLYPTHSCFDDALDYIGARALAHPELVDQTTLILVHGIALGDDGHPYAHAWCEEDGECWDTALVDNDPDQKISYAVPRADFYAARRIQESSSYTIRQAMALNAVTGHYGPWNEKYRAICGHGDRRIVASIQVEGWAAKKREW